MLSIVASALAHCNVCIDPQKPKFTEKPTILYLIFINIIGFKMVQFSVKADFGGQHKHCSALEPKP